VVAAEVAWVRREARCQGSGELYWTACQRVLRAARYPRFQSRMLSSIATARRVLVQENHATWAPEAGHP